MGTISSSVGLISGMDIQSLVKALMQIEARPLALLEQRIEATRNRQLAYSTLTAQLIAAKSSIHTLSLPTAFTGMTANSSNTDALKVSATSGAVPGSYSFFVRSLATSHQLVSQGFADRDTTPIGAGTLTFESADARVNQSTELAALNGFAGVRGGTIRITDGSGESADVRLADAVTVDDVLDAINSATGIAVSARVSHDGIVISDESGGAGSLIISDLGGGFAARDLGIAGVHATGEAVSNHSLLYLTEDARLSILNDGVGLRTNRLGADLRFRTGDEQQFDVYLSGNLRFGTKLAELNAGRGVRGDGTGQRIIRVTNRNGDSADVDLSSAQTLQDVASAISGAGLSVQVSLSGGKLIVTDSTGKTASNLKIEDVAGYAAADLGITGDVAEASISGVEIYRIDTLGAVLRAIKYAEGNEGRLTASIASDRKSIILTDNTAGLNASVEALDGSMAARDLGLLGGFNGNVLESRHLLAGLNTVLLSSLNGGNGIRTGPVTFNLRNSSSFSLDFSGADTLADIVDIINDDGRLSATVDGGGTGIVITDPTEGGGTFSASGETAEDLNLTSSGGDKLISGDLQLQYIAENTRLADLHGGNGITFGSIVITDSTGASATIKLTDKLHKTIGDVIDEINRQSIGVVASINDTGDGIKLQDTAGGSGTLTVAESGSTTAADLGIVGRADGTTLVGTFAATIEIDADDTLDDLIEKINKANAGIRASLVNDGTTWTPYRLTLTSRVSGLDGIIAFNTTTGGLKLNTLTEASDAVVVIGDGDSGSNIVIRSSTNSITDAVDGLTLDLIATSHDPVQVTVGHNTESVVKEAKRFVTAFNSAIDRMEDLTAFNAETGKRGILLGDYAVDRVRDRLHRALLSSANDPRLTFKNLTELGFRIANGGRLELDEEKFKKALSEDLEGVKKLFTLLGEDQEGKVTKIGLGARIDQAFDELTNSADGLLTVQSENLQGQIDMYGRRAEQLQELLDIKEARLYAQFQAMEKALANLQSQQSALTALANLAASSTVTNSRRLSINT